MTGSPSSIIMLGLGNGTFAGSPSLLMTFGYGIGAAVVVESSPHVFNVFDRQGEFNVKDRTGEFDVLDRRGSFSGNA